MPLVDLVLTRTPSYCIRCRCRPFPDGDSRVLLQLKGEADDDNGVGDAYAIHIINLSDAVFAHLHFIRLLDLTDNLYACASHRHEHIIEVNEVARPDHCTICHVVH